MNTGNYSRHSEIVGLVSLSVVINILCDVHHAQYCINIYVYGPTPWLLQQWGPGPRTMPKVFFQ